MLAHCGILRECVLRTAQACFGHRLMMDCIVPGGVGCDLLSPGFEQIRKLVWTIGKSVSATGRTLRQHGLAPEPHRWNRIGKARAHQAIRMRRHYRPASARAFDAVSNSPTAL